MFYSKSFAKILSNESKRWYIRNQFAIAKTGILEPTKEENVSGILRHKDAPPNTALDLHGLGAKTVPGGYFGWFGALAQIARTTATGVGRF